MLKMEIFRVEFPQTPSLTISFHTWPHQEGFFVYLKYQNWTGMGEANPFQPITGDSPEEFIEDAQKIPEIPIDPNIHNAEDLHNFLEQQITCQTLKAAIDFAFHDLLGKIQQMPTYQIYSSLLPLPDCSVTVFIQNSIDATVRETKAIYQRYPDLKILKIKLKGQDDIARAQAIKEISPAHMRFVLDANQGFSDPQQAVETLKHIGEILQNVILVEEPCPKRDLTKLRYVKEHLDNMLVFADESGATIEDVRKIIESQAAHGVNIKLQKAGGIWPAKKIAELCQQNGLKIMVGAMIEGCIAISAGVHFVASTQDTLLCDLDTDLGLFEYFYQPSPFQHGKRYPWGTPGITTVFCEEHVPHWTQQQKVIYSKC